MAKNKANRLKARVPRGFADRSPADIRETLRITDTIRTVYERWGFEPVETPLIEYADALGKFLPDADRPNEGVFAFQDDDEQWLSLRYDLTAPLARHVAENFDRTPRPYKSYRAGWVFRNEKPGPGRFRQFMQFDADIVGAASPLADAEICMMAADTMEALGFSRGEYRIRVNSRVVLDTLLDAFGIERDDTAKRLAILRTIDKSDKFSRGDIFALLTSGRLDPSGDPMPGVGLSEAEALVLMSRFMPFDPKAHDAALSDQEFSVDILSSDPAYLSLNDQVDNHEGFRIAMAQTEELVNYCRASGYDESRIIRDFSVVRGLEYYTGAVYEAELTFETTDDKGRPIRFGSVGGGGRYDGLVGRFVSQNVPATGFSVGVSRLQAALAARNTAGETPGPVIVTVMDRDTIPHYQAMTAKLRAALNQGGDVVPVEMYIGDSGMKAQLKYADRRNAPCVIIQGSDERDAGTVQIKDLAAGKAASEDITDRAEWVAARPAQQEVADDIDTIAAAVRAILTS